MIEVVAGLKLQVVRGQKAQELSKVVLHKPADFSFELFSRYRALDPNRSATKVSLRFGNPSFSLHGPMGDQVNGWLLRVLGSGEVIYIECWPWEFFIYTSGGSFTMERILTWLDDKRPEFRLIRGGKII